MVDRDQVSDQSLWSERISVVPIRSDTGHTISAREECADRLRMMAATIVILRKVSRQRPSALAPAEAHSMPHDFFGPPFTPNLIKLHPMSNPFFPIIHPKSYQLS